MIANDPIYTSKAKDVVLHFLQTAFANDKLFPTGNPYLYSEDAKSSKIMIADFNTENLNSINLKPAILVTRGQVTPRSLGLGDKTKQTFFGGYEERQLLLNVNVSVNCYSREGLEAEALAVIVFKLFRFMNEQIQKNYDVFDVSAQGIGSEQPVLKELIMVPVIMTISILEAIKINFKEIQLNKVYSGREVYKTEVPFDSTT